MRMRIQGHFGPHFIIFHRSWLLRLERALLAVDPGIESLPYWNIALDAYPDGKYRDDPDKYIFTDKYFGHLFTDPNDGGIVKYVGSLNGVWMLRHELLHRCVHGERAANC